MNMTIHAPILVQATPKRTLNMEFNAVTRLPYAGDHEFEVNCYGYALHVGACVNPGLHREKRDFSEVASRKSFLRALESDGLVQVPRREFDPSREHIIAAYLDVREDFHFARLDTTGWSHKPGYNWDPIQTDYFGNPFTDPETINMLTSDFIGYFSVPDKMSALTVCDVQKSILPRNNNVLSDYIKALV